MKGKVMAVYTDENGNLREFPFERLSQEGQAYILQRQAEIDAEEKAKAEAEAKAKAEAEAKETALIAKRFNYACDHNLPWSVVSQMTEDELK